jgi:hypothetical protein
MRYTARPDAVLVTSSGIGAGDWIDMPHNSMLVIDRATRDVSEILLQIARPAEPLLPGGAPSV